MKFSTKLRGRNSPSFFARSKKPVPTDSPLTQNVSKASAYFNNGRKTPTPADEPAEEMPVKDPTEVPFPDIQVDARQDEDDDSVSIQTEQREDIESVVSVATEYELEEEARDDGVAELTDGADDETSKVESDACKEEAAVEAVDVAEESCETKSDAENVEFSPPAAEGCKVSCAMGPPSMERPLAVIKDCKESLSKKFEEARPGLEQRASEMKTTIAGASTRAGTAIVGASVKAGTALAAGAVAVSTKAGASLANAGTQAGGMAKSFVCGDERALQYHAEKQEQVASPKQEGLSHVADVKSPTNDALGKFTLNRLLCGSYKCSDCVHDMAVGAVDIICLGYCDCTKDKESDDLSEIISPGTYDTNGRAFTFDSLDSYGNSTQVTDAESLNINLNLAKAALMAENRALMLQSVELTEGDFNQVKDTSNDLTPMANNNKGKQLKPFTPKSSGGRRSPFSPKAVNTCDAENVAVELVGQSLTPKKTSKRKTFFSFGRKTPDPEAKYKVQAIIEDEKCGKNNKVVTTSSSNSATGSQKTNFTGSQTLQIKNTKKTSDMALNLEKSNKRRSKGGSNDSQSKGSKSDEVSIVEGGQQSVYSL